MLFRGFLCFQLVRVAGWRIGPAIAVSSTMFALAHLPHIDRWFVEVLRGPAAMGVQAISDGERLLMVRAPAEVWLQFVSRRGDDLLLYGAPYALGGALFAWIAWRWQSLWPAVALHGAMNLWWVLAEGGSRLQFAITPMTVAHALAIALAIAFTFRHSRLRMRDRGADHTPVRPTSNDAKQAGPDRRRHGAAVSP